MIPIKHRKTIQITTMPFNSQYFRHARLEILEFIPREHSRILEIGCGEGTFSNLLPSKPEYWGIEPSKLAANEATRKLSKVLIGTYESTKDSLPDKYFDLIICNDVIEHMADHDNFLQSIKEKLSINGCIVGSVPNVRYLPNLLELLLEKDWAYRDAGILDKTHLRFFTQRSLQECFIRNGYFIDQLAGINGLWVHFSLLQVFRFLSFKVKLAVLGKDTRFPQFAFRIRLSKA
jgi:2-polyprenyl-3-methyl-5-hydroxy-6-metoxy-1,4-benzoquinol methylase